MANDVEAFNCLWGDCSQTNTKPIGSFESPPFNPGVDIQAVKPALGNWGTPIRVPMIGRPSVINNYYTLPGGSPVPAAASTAKAGSAGSTIFGFSPLVVLGAGAVALYFLSQMDGKK